MEEGNHKFDGRTFLLDYEYTAYLKAVPARWPSKTISVEGPCSQCSFGDLPENPLQRAHSISAIKGVVRFGLTPIWLDDASNLTPAHAVVCNDKAELDDRQTIDRLKNFYGITELPPFLSPYILNLWSGKKEEVFFWPPSEVLSSEIPSNTGFGGRMFLTFEEWQTFLRRPPNHGMIDKPKKELCEVCYDPGDEYSPLQNAHKIGFAFGIYELALTPDFLNSHVNLITAHRTRKDGYKCNMLSELSLKDAMLFLKMLGVSSLPDFLPATTLSLWKTL